MRHKVLILIGGLAVVGAALAVLIFYIPQVVPAWTSQGPEIDAQQQAQIRAINLAASKGRPVTQDEIIKAIVEAQADAQARAAAQLQ